MRPARRGLTLVELMIVVAIIGLLAAVTIPSLAHARLRSQEESCVNNLRVIQGAKESYAYDKKLPPNPLHNRSMTLSDLVPDYIKREPLCPAGGTYWLQKPGEDPKCSIAGSHRL